MKERGRVEPCGGGGREEGIQEEGGISRRNAFNIGKRDSRKGGRGGFGHHLLQFMSGGCFIVKREKSGNICTFPSH